MARFLIMATNGTNARMKRSKMPTDENDSLMILTVDDSKSRITDERFEELIQTSSDQISFLYSVEKESSRERGRERITTHKGRYKFLHNKSIMVDLIV